MGTVYHYQIHSANSSGSLAVSPDATFTTATVPPVISGVSAGSITQTGAAVAWSTDQASTSQVDYGTTSAYGTSTTLNSAMVTSHSQSLGNLLAGTAYHYRVRSTNSSGNVSVSSDATFTTSTPAVPVSAAIALVQQKTATYSSAASAVVNLNSAARAGSALVLFSANNSVSIKGVSGGGVSWVRGSSSGSHSVAEIWYGLNSSGSGTAVTVTYSDASGSGGVNVSEFAGVATSAALDVAPAGNSGISATPATPSAVTTHANDLILAAGADISVASTVGGPSNSFTPLAESANSNKIIPAYRTVSAIGTYSTSWMEGFEGWDAVVVALKGIN